MNKLRQILYYKLDDYEKQADAFAEANWDEKQLRAAVKMLAQDVKFLVNHFKELLDNPNIYEGLMLDEEKVSNKKGFVVQPRLPKS